MSSQNNSDNQFDGATIQRSLHDQKNPYTMVLNDLIRDTTISPDCIWLIIYLLSNKEGWVINISQIVNFMKGRWGKDKVYGIINEAIDAGYMKKEVRKVRNLNRFTYHLAERPIFKKMFSHPGFSDPDFSDPRNTDINKEHMEQGTSKENVTVCASPPPSGGSPPVNPLENHEKITKKHLDGSEFTITKSNLFEKAILERTDWNDKEVDLAWETLVKYTKPITDWFKFCQGTIENQRKITQLKTIKIQDTKCQKKVGKIKTTFVNLPQSKKQSEIINAKTSEKDTLAPPSPDWWRDPKLYTPFNRSSLSQKTS